MSGFFRMMSVIMHAFGSHVSVAGGLDKGVERAMALGCDCIQVFTKNANAWIAKPLMPEAISKWSAAWAGSGMVHPIAHASYLINLAAPDSALWRKSIDALVIEWQRCEQLQLEGLVLHPGAFTTSSQSEGLARVADALTEAIERTQPRHTRLLLENTAGQGTCLGHELEQLAGLVDSSDVASRRHLGVCLDTCHAFAAGYPIHTAAGFVHFRNRLADLFAPTRIAAVHLNDSKKPMGSRVDRHEHIGRGALGLDGFRLWLADPWLGSIPGYLETEKGVDPQTGRDWDAINLDVLRRVVAEINGQTT